jgi:hypothetical protein
MTTKSSLKRSLKRSKQRLPHGYELVRRKKGKAGRPKKVKRGRPRKRR